MITNPGNTPTPEEEKAQQTEKALHDARIALTFYREYLSKRLTLYPFGVEAENAIRKILGEHEI